MPQNHNSASRVLDVLKSIPTLPDNTQSLAVWVMLFAIQESNAHRQSRVVADRLAAINRELELIRIGMAKATFSESLYTNALNAYEAAFSPMQLPHSWNNVRRYLISENELALQFCSEILPDEESEIPEGELEAIRKLVEELQGLLIDSKLPTRLQALIAHHVELMLQGLIDYPISGAKALREAARSGLGELVEVKDIVAEHQNSKEISKLGQAWKTLNQAADQALKFDKLIQVGQKAWTLIESVWLK